MIKTTLNWNIKNLMNMYNFRETLDFEHPIQRQSSQWSNLQQSLLVHSLLANYPVPSLYVQKVDSDEKDEKGKPVFKYSVLDGKQRLTTIFGFVDGEYALHEETPSVEIDGEKYELAGKLFDDLESEVQQELLRYKFLIYAFEDTTDDEVEEIFFRLNNSTPLSKPQKAKPLMGVSNATFINKILKDSFFTEKCSFSQLQLRKSDDLCTLLQSMMLLDAKYWGYEYSSISADEVMRYSSHIKDNYTYEQQILLTTTLDYLDKAFSTKEKLLKKINIPIVILLADKAITNGIKPNDFYNWFLYFFVACKAEYNQYCSSGSIKKEKVNGRINVMTSHFDNHFRINDLEIENKKYTDEDNDSSTVVIPTEDIIPEELDEETIPEGVEESESENTETTVDTNETYESYESDNAENKNEEPENENESDETLQDLDDENNMQDENDSCNEFSYESLVS